MTSMRNRKLNFLLSLLVLTSFVFLEYWKYSGDNGSGDDLSSSYVGCRLMSSGQALGHLYQHDPVDFSAIGPDQVWQDAADRGNFIGYLHPYVQTPLWAYLLEPACTRMTFVSFKNLFAALTLASFALSVWLIARYWTPSLYHPVSLSVILLLLSISQPFGYAMFLMQTHVLFFTMTIAGLMLAEHRRPGWAGLLLAFAAAVKVTPGLIILYWIFTRRWKAAASTGVWLLLLSGFTAFACGLPLLRLYLAELSRVGHVLLLSQNNQSLAAWWMSRFYSYDEIQEITIHALPNGIRLVSAALMIGGSLFGAWLDRRRMREANSEPPFGAVMAMLAATLFAPIAWTHYSILLIAPLMLFAQADITRPARLLKGLMLAIFLLNVPPLATDVIHGEIGCFGVLHGQFFAGVLCFAGLAWLAFRRSSADARPARIRAVGMS